MRWVKRSLREETDSLLSRCPCTENSCELASRRNGIISAKKKVEVMLTIAHSQTRQANSTALCPATLSPITMFHL